MDAEEGVRYDGPQRDGKASALEGSTETPRSDGAICVKISTPSTVMAESVGEDSAKPGGGYFMARPAASEIQRHPVMTSSDPSSPSAYATEPMSPGEPKTRDFATVNGMERPTAHSTSSGISAYSSDSTSTVSAASSAPNITTSVRSRPDFPNQAYSALHTQRYPVPRIAPTFKQRGTHPGQILTFASALASQHQSSSRHVNSSAPVTPGPGLYQQQPPPSSSEWESVANGTYASPFLHFTSRALPKETYVADVDVDPISGRKLINHYEIIDELGRGTHGKVKLGRDLDEEGKFVAIKIVDRFSKKRKLGKLGTTEDKVKKEVAILKQVRHPNVTALLEVIDDPTRKKVYIVLEWVELGQIEWRVKGAKEIAMIEAQRYEREKSGKVAALSEAEDAALIAEARKRLSGQRRRATRTARQTRRDAPSEVWSNEIAGEEDSGASDDDKWSRASTESHNSSSLLPTEGRRSSRTPSPLPPTTAQYLSLTDEPQTQSPTTSANIYSGLEGTMYGPYAPYIPATPSSGEHSRVSSSQSASAMRKRALTSSERLSQMASEVLDSDLNDELENVPCLTIHQTRIAFRDTLIGLQYLHYQGIIHRDIKPPNLLETKEHRVKISDFGVSYLGRAKGENEAVEDVGEHETQDLEDGAKELAKTVGTPAFYAPELCITEVLDDAPPITKAIDIWALGVTLFCMLFARTPFVDNEFVVMRQIAEDEIYIPKKRLKPVQGQVRITAAQRRALPMTPDRRHDLDIAYEDIDADLHNLLKRMLVKDPRKRITLEEVRHHPWVVADIQDKLKWLEETDTSRQSQGKKIEVSKEDVSSAVVPLQFLDRVRNSIKNFGERLGFGSRPATRGRSRTSVGGGIEVSPTTSSSSPSTVMSPNTERSSTRSSENMLSPAKASNETDHPLSRSVNASPEQEARTAASSSQSGASPASELTSTLSPLNLPERGRSDVPASGSMRTVRQSDFQPGEVTGSPPASPRASIAPTTIDSTSGDSTTSSGRLSRILQSIREKSLARSEGRPQSSDRASIGSHDPRSEASVTLSQDNATGQLSSPAAPGTPTSPIPSGRNSPAGSRSPSVASPSFAERLFPTTDAALSRTSSSRSISSLGVPAVEAIRSSSRSPAAPHTSIPLESTHEDWKRANNERVQRLAREARQDPQTPLSFDAGSPCPPSPDDLRISEPGSRQMSALDISNAESSQEASPIGHGSQLQAAIASSTSDFGSSASMSNPSMPSVVSESSVELPEPVLEGELPKATTDLLSSDDTVRAPPKSEARSRITSDYDDDDDDSSDSDGGLVMSGRRKSAATGAAQSRGARISSNANSVSASSKSSRRGSNNTMKRLSPRESADEQKY